MNAGSYTVGPLWSWYGCSGVLISILNAVQLCHGSLWPWYFSGVLISITLTASVKSSATLSWVLAAMIWMQWGLNIQNTYSIYWMQCNSTVGLCGHDMVAVGSWYSLTLIPSNECGQLYRGYIDLGSSYRWHWFHLMNAGSYTVGLCGHDMVAMGSWYRFCRFAKWVTFLDGNVIRLHCWFGFFGAYYSMMLNS